MKGILKNGAAFLVLVAINTAVYYGIASINAAVTKRIMTPGAASKTPENVTESTRSNFVASISGNPILAVNAYRVGIPSGGARFVAGSGSYSDLLIRPSDNHMLKRYIHLFDYHFALSVDSEGKTYLDVFDADECRDFIRAANRCMGNRFREKRVERQIFDSCLADGSAPAVLVRTRSKNSGENYRDAHLYARIGGKQVDLLSVEPAVAESRDRGRSLKELRDGAVLDVDRLPLGPPAAILPGAEGSATSILPMRIAVNDYSPEDAGRMSDSERRIFHSLRLDGDQLRISRLWKRALTGFVGNEPNRTLAKGLGMAFVRVPTLPPKDFGFELSVEDKILALRPRDLSINGPDASSEPGRSPYAYRFSNAKSGFMNRLFAAGERLAGEVPYFRSRGFRRLPRYPEFYELSVRDPNIVLPSNGSRKLSLPGVGGEEADLSNFLPLPGEQANVVFVEFPGDFGGLMDEGGDPVDPPVVRAIRVAEWFHHAMDFSGRTQNADAPPDLALRGPKTTEILDRFETWSHNVRIGSFLAFLVVALFHLFMVGRMYGASVASRLKALPHDSTSAAPSRIRRLVCGFPLWLVAVFSLTAFGFPLQTLFYLSEKYLVDFSTYLELLLVAGLSILCAAFMIFDLRVILRSLRGEKTASRVFSGFAQTGLSALPIAAVGRCVLMNGLGLSRDTATAWVASLLGVWICYWAVLVLLLAAIFMLKVPSTIRMRKKKLSGPAPRVAGSSSVFEKLSAIGGRIRSLVVDLPNKDWIYRLYQAVTIGGGLFGAGLILLDLFEHRALANALAGWPLMRGTGAWTSLFLFYALGAAWAVAMGIDGFGYGRKGRWSRLTAILPELELGTVALGAGVVVIHMFLNEPAAFKIAAWAFWLPAVGARAYRLAKNDEGSGPRCFGARIALFAWACFNFLLLLLPGLLLWSIGSWLAWSVCMFFLPSSRRGEENHSPFWRFIDASRDRVGKWAAEFDHVCEMFFRFSGGVFVYLFPVLVVLFAAVLITSQMVELWVPILILALSVFISGWNTRNAAAPSVGANLLGAKAWRLSPAAACWYPILIFGTVGVLFLPLVRNPGELWVFGRFFIIAVAAAFFFMKFDPSGAKQEWNATFMRRVVARILFRPFGILVYRVMVLAVLALAFALVNWLVVQWLPRHMDPDSLVQNSVKRFVERKHAKEMPYYAGNNEQVVDAFWTVMDDTRLDWISNMHTDFAIPSALAVARHTGEKTGRLAVAMAALWLSALVLLLRSVRRNPFKRFLAILYVSYFLFRLAYIVGYSFFGSWLSGINMPFVAAGKFGFASNIALIGMLAYMLLRPDDATKSTQKAKPLEVTLFLAAASACLLLFINPWKVAVLIRESVRDEPPRRIEDIWFEGSLARSISKDAEAFLDASADHPFSTELERLGDCGPAAGTAGSIQSLCESVFRAEDTRALDGDADATAIWRIGDRVFLFYRAGGAGDKGLIGFAQIGLAKKADTVDGVVGARSRIDDPLLSVKSEPQIYTYRGYYTQSRHLRVRLTGSRLSCEPLYLDPGFTRPSVTEAYREKSLAEGRDACWLGTADREGKSPTSLRLAPFKSRTPEMTFLIQDNGPYSQQRVVAATTRLIFHPYEDAFSRSIPDRWRNLQFEDLWATAVQSGVVGFEEIDGIGSRFAVRLTPSERERFARGESRIAGVPIVERRAADRTLETTNEAVVKELFSYKHRPPMRKALRRIASAADRTLGDPTNPYVSIVAFKKDGGDAGDKRFEVMGVDPKYVEEVHRKRFKHFSPIFLTGGDVAPDSRDYRASFAHRYFQVFDSDGARRYLFLPRRQDGRFAATRYMAPAGKERRMHLMPDGIVAARNIYVETAKAGLKKTRYYSVSAPESGPKDIQEISIPNFEAGFFRCAGVRMTDGDPVSDAIRKLFPKAVAYRWFDMTLPETISGKMEGEHLLMYSVRTNRAPYKHAFSLVENSLASLWGTGRWAGLETAILRQLELERLVDGKDRTDGPRVARSTINGPMQLIAYKIVKSTIDECYRDMRAPKNQEIMKRARLRPEWKNWVKGSVILMDRQGRMPVLLSYPESSLQIADLDKEKEFFHNQIVNKRTQVLSVYKIICRNMINPSDGGFFDRLRIIYSDAPEAGTNLLAFRLGWREVLRAAGRNAESKKALRALIQNEPLLVERFKSGKSIDESFLCDMLQASGDVEICDPKAKTGGVAQEVLRRHHEMRGILAHIEKRYAIDYYRHRALTEPIKPGSVMKPLSMMALWLEEGILDFEGFLKFSPFLISGSRPFGFEGDGEPVFRDVYFRSHYLSEAITNSINTFVVIGVLRALNHDPENGEKVRRDGSRQPGRTEPLSVFSHGAWIELKRNHDLWTRLQNVAGVGPEQTAADPFRLVGGYGAQIGRSFWPAHDGALPTFYLAGTIWENLEPSASGALLDGQALCLSASNEIVDGAFGGHRLCDSVELYIPLRSYIQFFYGEGNLKVLPLLIPTAFVNFLRGFAAPARPRLFEGREKTHRASPPQAVSSGEEKTIDDRFAERGLKMVRAGMAGAYGRTYGLGNWMTDEASRRTLHTVGMLKYAGKTGTIVPLYAYAGKTGDPVAVKLKKLLGDEAYRRVFLAPDSGRFVTFPNRDRRLCARGEHEMKECVKRFAGYTGEPESLNEDDPSLIPAARVPYVAFVELDAAGNGGHIAAPIGHRIMLLLEGMYSQDR